MLNSSKTKQNLYQNNPLLLFCGCWFGGHTWRRSGITHGSAWRGPDGILGIESRWVACKAKPYPLVTNNICLSRYIGLSLSIMLSCFIYPCIYLAIYFKIFFNILLYKFQEYYLLSLCVLASCPHPKVLSEMLLPLPYPLTLLSLPALVAIIFLM